MKSHNKKTDTKSEINNKEKNKENKEMANNSKTKVIKGIKITLSKRSKSSWIIYHNFEDAYDKKLSQRSRTFGKNSNTKIMDEAFEKAYSWVINTQNKINNGVIEGDSNITLENIFKLYGDLISQQMRQMTVIIHSLKCLHSII